MRAGLEADLLITSAGVSRGDYDVVKDVLLREGEVDFWTVRMRPGKPLAFGVFPAGETARPPHRPAGQPGELDGDVRALRPAGGLQDDGQAPAGERPVLRVTLEERVVNTDPRRFSRGRSSASARAAITRR